MNSSQRYERLHRLFEAVRDLPPPEREKMLDRQCADDPALRSEVEQLLARHAEPRGFLQRPALGSSFSVETAATVVEPALDLLDKRIGHYHLKRVIASGGMGTVYEASQEKPSRTVAVKVMRQGIASKSALRRFEYESQILARLRHPGIAQIHEAGTYGANGGGVPYFVMEYIPNALPITEHVRQNKLATHERLELFGAVCDAVHHGHQRGIIHRDLKPANILIDALGQPKIIDFGVARATDSDIALTTFQTDVGELIGTLQYMSPEQCQADPHDLDTRSDVYALGVVLYELLCEQLPYDVTHAPVPEAVRVVREETPIRPSTFNKTLRGDVETILLKALAKERERRYQSAAELAGDITRYLRHEPIVAQPPSVGYQVRMFARRNKTVFGAMAAVLVVLVAAVVVSLTLTIRATAAEQDAQQRQATAEKVTELLQGMLSTADPHQVKGPNYKVRQLLDDFGAVVGDELADQPEIEASIRATLGNAYHSLGAYDHAETHLKAALDIRKRIFGKEHPLIAESLADYAWYLHRQADYETSASMLEEALAMQRKFLGEEHKDVARTLHYLGDIKQHLGQSALALSLVEQALDIQRRLLGEEHPDTLFSMFALAWVYHQQSHFAEAESLYLKTLEGQRRVLGEEHPKTLNTMREFSHLYAKQHRYDEALALALNTLDVSRGVWGEEHKQTLRPMRDLAWTYRGQGRLDEAEPMALKALDVNRSVLGEEHPDTLWSMRVLARIYRYQGRLDEAEPLALKALDVSRSVLGEEHPDTLFSMGELGFMYLQQGRHDEAEQLFRDLLARRRNKLTDGDPRIAGSLLILGFSLVKQERYGEAEPLLRECLEIRETVLLEGLASPLQVAHARSVLGASLAGQGRLEEAEPLLLEGYARMSDNPQAAEIIEREALERLIELYETWDRPEKAEEYRALLPVAQDTAASD